MRKLFILTAFVLSFASCATSDSVKYVEAQHYFVNNNTEAANLKEDSEPVLLKVTAKDDFDRLFGMAAVMGKNGQPTPVDFSKEFVVAVIAPVTDRAATLRPLSLKKTGDKTLTLSYAFRQGASQSYSMQPVFLLKVSNRYADWRIVGRKSE